MIIDVSAKLRVDDACETIIVFCSRVRGSLGKNRYLFTVNKDDRKGEESQKRHPRVCNVFVFCKCTRQKTYSRHKRLARALFLEMFNKLAWRDVACPPLSYVFQTTERISMSKHLRGSSPVGIRLLHTTQVLRTIINRNYNVKNVSSTRPVYKFNAQSCPVRRYVSVILFIHFFNVYWRH